MAIQEPKFEGWLGLAPDSVEGKMEWKSYTPKTWEETDVDIKITHTGVCGSDIHTLRSGWGPSNYPICVGHEIVGTAIRVGSKVLHISVGDRVGVGAQSDSCQNRPEIRKPVGGCKECEECKSGEESYCACMVGTYGGVHFNGDKSYGGYGLYNRCPAHFVIPIPEGVESVHAASMMCGGVSLYSPLSRYGTGPGKSVGIVGLGGLGHFGVLFARALGADRVVAISRRANKREDALKLGADLYIATADDEDWVDNNRATLDLIVSTVPSSKMPLLGYTALLKTGGTLVQVGVPEDGALEVPVFGLIFGRKQLAGSLIGSPGEIAEMLALAADKGVKPWVTEIPMVDANQAVVDMAAGKARYRYVLVNKDSDKVKATL